MAGAGTIRKKYLTFFWLRKVSIKNVILDRFPIARINQFNQQLEELLEIKIVISVGENVSSSEDTECLSSHSLSKGIGLENYPWVLDRTTLEYFTKHEGIILSMLSRYDVYKNSLCKHLQKSCV